MKKLLIIPIALALLSCSKVEEKINETIDKTAESVKKSAEEKVKQQVEESLNKIANSESVEFQQAFPDTGNVAVTEFKGRKVDLPIGSSVYVFKYKADKNELIPALEKQATTDESRSDKEAAKVDGKNIIDKISLLQKFIPEGVVDTRFLEDIKTDKNIEFYKLRRIPNNSTIIINPQTNQVFHFIEIVK